MKTTRQVSRTALLSRFVHAAMPWGLCSRCGWCLVPVPCLVPVRALIVSSFNPSPASRHTQPAHGDSAVFFSDLSLTLASCLVLPCLWILPVIPLTLSMSLVSLPCLLHLRLRCIDSPAQSTPQPPPVPCSTPFHRLSFSFSFYSRTCLRGLYVYILVHLQVSNRAVLTSHKPWPGLCIPHASPRYNSTHLPFDIPLSIHPPTAPRTLVRLFVW